MGNSSPGGYVANKDLVATSDGKVIARPKNLRRLQRIGNMLYIHDSDNVLSYDIKKRKLGNFEGFIDMPHKLIPEHFIAIGVYPLAICGDYAATSTGDIYCKEGLVYKHNDKKPHLFTTKTFIILSCKITYVFDTRNRNMTIYMFEVSNVTKFSDLVRLTNGEVYDLLNNKFVGKYLFIA